MLRIIWIILNFGFGIWMCNVASNFFLEQSYWWCVFALIVGALNFNAACINYFELKDTDNE
jgi:hypothetical protein